MDFIKKMACAAVFLAAAATAHAAQQSRFTITDLGDSFNPAFGGIFASAVNDRGEITGWAYAGAQVPQHHAFLWDSGAKTDLGVPPGGYESTAYGMNNRGTVVGESGGHIAWYQDGAWTQLDLFGVANDVNDGGTIVGGYTNNVGTHGYLLKDGVFIDMGTLGGSYSVAFAVNKKDVAVGYSYNGGSSLRAFVFENGAMRDLGTLGGSSSYAFDINNRGDIVGASDDGAFHTVATIYDGSMRRLLPMATNFSVARSINDHGDVVGTSDGHAFLLESNGTLTYLDQLPEAVSGGWMYMQPLAISNRGWIVGTAWHNGHSRSFLITFK